MTLPAAPLHAASQGPAGAQARPDALLWTGLILTLTPALIRASSNIETLPGWDLDPFTSPLIRSGLAPAGSMLCDALSLLGAASLLLFARARRLPISPVTFALGGLGSFGVLAHAFARGLPGVTPTIADERIGLAWFSAIWCAIALFHAARDARAARVVTAALLGFVVLLALRAAHEFFIDHPRTIADYHLNREHILAAHGWSPDSSMAKAFERRLFQFDASGWFGLSNVLAALCAAASTIVLGLLFALRRAPSPEPDRRTVPLLLFGALASLGGLALAQSKGGLIAFLSGIAALLLFLWLAARRDRLGQALTRRLAGLLGLVSIAGALTLITLRGLIGERLGELSILFRWFYAQAALRIFRAHPLVGVGPDGFQSAYALYKNPLSPEEVSSPHIILLDWLSMLGVLGLAWGALLICWAWRAGAAAVSPAPIPPDPDTRNQIRAALGIAALATLGAAFIQGPIVTPDIALLRTFGLLAWAVAAWGVLRALNRPINPRPALAAGALVLLAHGQIDVELSWVQSCGIGLALIALAASGNVRANPRAADACSNRVLVAALVLALLAGASVPLAILPAWRWERALLEAASTVHPVADFNDRLTELSAANRAGRAPPESLDRIVADMSRALGAGAGRTIRPTNDDIRRALIELDASAAERAVPLILQADARDPDDPRLRREASRLWVRYADANRVLGRADALRAGLDHAVAVLTDRLNSGPNPHSMLHVSLAQIRLRRADLLNDPSELPLAAQSLDQAIALDPYNLDLARQRFRLAQRLSDPAATRRWAAKALELDRLMRLDPEVRALTPAEREELQHAVQTP